MKRLDERSQWESEWAEAFREGRQSPPDSVWNKLDGVLANKEAKKYKKRAFYYKWLAAASVFVSVCGAVLLMQNNFGELVQPETAGRPAQQESTTEKQLNRTEPKIAEAEQPKAETQPKSQSQSQSALPAVAENEQQSGQRGQQPDALALQEKTEKSTGIGLADNRQTKNAENEHLESPAAAGLEEHPAAVLVAGREEKEQAYDKLNKKGFIEADFKSGVTAEMQKVWVATDMLKKEKASSPKYLLGASLASNYFNPNYQESGNLVATMVENNALHPKKGQMSTARISEWDKEVEAENPVTMNGGVQAAAWISEKWVVQSGVAYGNYKSVGQAGSYIDAESAQAYPLHYSNFSADKIQRVSSGARISAPVSVVNSFEFISVPLSIGYVVFDHKLGLMVSPGISSEFFLSNQLSGEGHGLSTYTTYGGAESPYKRVHLRGQIGAQLYYKLGENYMISLEPSFQQSITDFHKSGSYFQSRPSNMGVAAGFRYIIR